MSVFGGDSWAREAQYRRRRVDDLLTEAVDASSFRKLSNGKYACLACPHNPILDSPLMLSMHCKGSRHRAAESGLNEIELKRKDEINKRIALSDSSVCSTSSCNFSYKHRPTTKPLIERTLKAASEILSNKVPLPISSVNGKSNVNSSLPAAEITQMPSFPMAGTAEKTISLQHLDFKERRERELKFTAAGWKRDCHGRWFKDDNVEFDSDEEDPNVSLA